jgi:hypothetical protein
MPTSIASIKSQLTAIQLQGVSVALQSWGKTETQTLANSVADLARLMGELAEHIEVRD